jgi:beta-glucanase (GH16 family)
MKNTYLLLFCVFTFIQPNVSGQTGFPYQAVLRNDAGLAIGDRDVNVRFSIRQTIPDGTAVYQENHQAKTDAAGLFTLEIGKGEKESGSFETIVWADGPYFIATEVDYGSGYKITGVQELGNIPYAQHAETAGSLQKITANKNTTWQLTVDDWGNLATIPIPKGYSKLVFQDEFNGTGLPDPNKWIYEEGFVRNQEMQYFTTERIENVFRQNGILTIRCINNDTLKNLYGEVLNKKTVNGNDYYITSGSVRTKGKSDWKYGRIEVKVKLPGGSGTWPAIWMMPTDSYYGAWPKSGEIDIMEHIGNTPNIFHYTAHYQATSKGFTSTHQNAVTDWHVFALEWKEGQMEWYCDNELWGRYKDLGNGWEYWPFDQRFYLILNLSFGGNWGGGSGFNVNLLPLDYQIDYVRVFQ